MVAVHGVGETHVRAEPPQHVFVEMQHRLAVRARVPLRPEQVAAVLLHLPRAREEDGEVAVGQVAVVRQLLRPPDVDFRQRFADVPRPGMEHQPDAVLGVQAQLEEVVPAAERAQLVPGLRFQVAHRGGQLLEIAPQLRVPLHRALALLESDRDGALDLAAQPT